MSRLKTDSKFGINGRNATICLGLLIPVFTGCHSEEPPSTRSTKPASLQDTHGKEAPKAQSSSAAPTTPFPPTERSEPHTIQELVSETDVSALQNETAFALQDDDHDRAFRLARQLVRVAPNEPTSIFLMARVLGRRNRFPEAIQLLDELATTSPDAKLPVLGQTAQWLVQFGKWEEAERRFRLILDDVPEVTLAHRELAKLLLRQGRAAEARKHLQTLCQLGDIEEIELRHLLSGGIPFHRDTSRSGLSPIGDRGRAIFHIGGGEWDLAKEELESAESLSPSASAVLGRIYAQQNDADSLIAWSESDSMKVDLLPESHFPTAVIFARKGNHRAAIRKLCEAVLFNQTDSEAYDLLSLCLLETNQIEESQEAANRARLIADTQRMGREMSLSEDRSEPELERLIQLLDELQRPWEALHWCGIRLAYAKKTNSLTTDELDRLATEIKKRSTTLEQNTPVPNRQFLTCGVSSILLEESDAPEKR